MVLALLLVALFYVRWLLKQAQVIEAEAHTADRLAVLGTLASGLAHEIRNPLSAINLNLQMIEEEVSQSRNHSGEMTQLLAGAKSEIRRLERLARNFLVYAKPLKPDRLVVSLPPGPGPGGPIGGPGVRQSGNRAGGGRMDRGCWRFGVTGICCSRPS